VLPWSPVLHGYQQKYVYTDAHQHLLKELEHFLAMDIQVSYHVGEEIRAWLHFQASIWHFKLLGQDVVQSHRLCRTYSQSIIPCWLYGRWLADWYLI